MRSLRLSWVVLLGIPLISSWASERISLKQMDSISGTGLQVVQVALPKFVEKKLVLEKYKVKVYDAGSSYVVIFDDPNRRMGQLPGTAAVPVYEVEVAKDGLKVLRAMFSR